ncbi:trypsin-4-like [Nomia melanderi]|uniref:trypsin-4-like n=1 Tax=Nomia melanderi TaxID=2448451 RepID=UPI0013045E4D|nr:trypsin-4-like [Nomia melanderi]
MLLAFLLLAFAFADCYDPRIIGGSSTTINQYPYQVSIHFNGKLICGGSIISPDWVLTAAHCVYGYNPSSFTIRTKSTYGYQDGTLITGIQRIYTHDYYDDETDEYDAALIKLPSPIKVDANARPIGLPSPGSSVPTGSVAVVTGWGYTSVGGSTPSKLQVLNAPVVDQNTCKKIYATKYKEVTKAMLCAGTMVGGQDTCQGDSGGPLVYKDVQIGIVSWGFECARPGFPGVYTRVSEVRSWIDKTRRSIK